MGVGRGKDRSSMCSSPLPISTCRLGGEVEEFQAYKLAFTFSDSNTQTLTDGRYGWINPYIYDAL